MIVLEPLRDDHIARFPEPLDEFPLDFWRDKAVAAVENGRVLGICGLRKIDETVVCGLLATDDLRRRPIYLHRTVLYGISGLREMGIKYLKATAETSTGARWLKRLGFERAGKWYVKCLV